MARNSGGLPGEYGVGGTGSAMNEQVPENIALADDSLAPFSG